MRYKPTTWLPCRVRVPVISGSANPAPQIDCDSICICSRPRTPVFEATIIVGHSAGHSVTPNLLPHRAYQVAERRQCHKLPRNEEVTIGRQTILNRPEVTR